MHRYFELLNIKLAINITLAITPETLSIMKEVGEEESFGEGRIISNQEPEASMWELSENQQRTLSSIQRLQPGPKSHKFKVQRGEVQGTWGPEEASLQGISHSQVYLQKECSEYWNEEEQNSKML